MKRINKNMFFVFFCMSFNLSQACHHHLIGSEGKSKKKRVCKTVKQKRQKRCEVDKGKKEHTGIKLELKNLKKKCSLGEALETFLQSYAIRNGFVCYTFK